jgi:hypothetical protein
MYHFRKLNRTNLVAPEVIFKNKEELCSEVNNLALVVEYIPVRLNSVNHFLTFEERLSILAATFSALQTLNYVYGPLFISETMIGFNEDGRVKVWIN